MLTWPGLVYPYSFSTSNFAIGRLCISLGLYLLASKRRSKLWAAIPIASLLHLGQPLVLPLSLCFSVLPTYRWQEERHNILRFAQRLNCWHRLRACYGIQQLPHSLQHGKYPYVAHY